MGVINLCNSVIREHLKLLMGYIFFGQSSYRESPHKIVLWERQKITSYKKPSFSYVQGTVIRPKCIHNKLFNQSSGGGAGGHLPPPSPQSFGDFMGIV